MNALSDSLAALDAYAGVEVEIGGRMVTLQALTFADGIRFTRLAERVHAGGMDADLAARRISYELPRAVGLDPDDLDEEDFARLFERMFDPGQYAPEEAPTDEELWAEDIDTEMATFRWEDLLADFAAHYGGAPAPDAPWPIVLALLQRMPRFENRARLRLLDSVTNAIAGAFGASRELEHIRRRLVEAAYPGKGPRLKFTQNVFANDPEEDP